MSKINFASDNYAGIHPEILQAIHDANQGPAVAYGNDEFTAKAILKFREQLGDDIEVFFVFNGTAANVLSLSAMNRSFHAVICPETAHIQVDECGAPEKFSGSKLLLMPTKNGKLSVAELEKYLHRVGDQHHVQPGVISISQSTECGTVYSVDEIKAIADFAHQHHLYLHMDGARIANAAVSLQKELRTFTKEIGVDVLSFGGTKNGLMLGEAVVFFNKKLADDFLYIRKQGMQLASKMRFISAQFHALFSNDLWKRNATHANKMAAYFANKLKTISSVTLTQTVQANAIFAIMPGELINKLQQHFSFYYWNESLSEVRLMTSFDTKESEIDQFIAMIK
ncbi:Low specificity L-threonine aldolase [Legionella steigerwaltii]|uniref:Low specificity L-threonine aldolase n=1 Tax=Legionella steigerwaltii TaxID=460 RepID=A0A378L976_9GAMM|nr:low specificity L-threonine aldolase [Legionella steigerwaltii]KTD77379.1 Low specificity L-threonine aldolase [Legionella steigerwaltii]STY22259.1 Low specificity L-threonine aldolase [Legionella steigerwaltii]